MLGRLDLAHAACLVAALVCALAWGTQAHAEQATYRVRTTYYHWTNNPTYSGEWPYVGSAACSWNFPLYTVLEFPDGHQVRCNDRGGGLGSTGWVDVYAPTRAYGQAIAERYSPYSPVRVLRWGWDGEWLGSPAPDDADTTETDDTITTEGEYAAWQ